MKTRLLKQTVMKGLMILSAAILLIGFSSLIWTIFSHGLPYMSWEMVSSIPGGGFYIGKEGGILNAILGTVIITTVSAAIALIIGSGVVLVLNLYAKRFRRTVSTIRMVQDVLFGIPSIVYGAFAFAIMISFGLRTSMLAGIITVTLLILPIMIRAIDEVVRQIPEDLVNSVFSLGATRLETAGVLLRQALPGIVTAIMLSVARAAGDAASLLFTSGYSDNLPFSPDQPAATLPLAIFFQLSSPIAEVQGRAYAAALILTLIILIISLSAKWISSRLSKHRIR
ncbi:MAG: ABC transporter permease subunit [Bacteroidetes bacterium]|nr:ABC transporter permease subunit [Bacteroidota bacterium]